VELFFYNIQTTLGMDVLRCCSLELVEKEIWMQVFGNNLVRALMLEASCRLQRVRSARLSTLPSEKMRSVR